MKSTMTISKSSDQTNSFIPKQKDADIQLKEFDNSPDMALLSVLGNRFIGANGNNNRTSGNLNVQCASVLGNRLSKSMINIQKQEEDAEEEVQEKSVGNNQLSIVSVQKQNEEENETAEEVQNKVEPIQYADKSEEDT